MYKQLPEDISKTEIDQLKARWAFTEVYRSENPQSALEYLQQQSISSPWVQMRTQGTETVILIGNEYVDWDHFRQTGEYQAKGTSVTRREPNDDVSGWFLNTESQAKRRNADTQMQTHIPAEQ